MGFFKKIFQQTLCTAAIGASAVSLLLPANAQQQVVVAYVAEYSQSPEPTQCTGAEGVECTVSDSMSMVPEWEAPAPARKISKRKKLKAVAQAGRTKIDERKYARALQAALDTWDTPAEEVAQAENTDSVEDRLIAAELENEAPLESRPAIVDWRMEAAQPDVDAALDFNLPRWSLPVEIVGNFAKNDFSAIHTRFKNIRKFEKDLQSEETERVVQAKREARKKIVAKKTRRPRVVAAEKVGAPKVVAAPAVVEPVVVQAVAPVVAAQDEVGAAPTASSANVAPSADPLKPKLASADFASGLSEVWVRRMQELSRDEAPAALVAEPPAAPKLISAPAAVETRSTAAVEPPAARVLDARSMDATLAQNPSSEPFLVTETASNQLSPTIETAPIDSQAGSARKNTAAAPVTTQSTQGFSIAHLTTPPVKTAQTSEPRSAVFPAPTPVPVPVPRTSTMYMASHREVSKLPFGTHLEGRITVDAEVEDFLASRQASLELFLVPTNRKDLTDPVFLLRYPDQIFRLDAEKLSGEFQVVALAFTKELSDPVGRAVYPETITSENARQNIRFNIELGALLSGVVAQDPSRRQVPVSLSIFDGASAEHREPNPIVGARVQIAGLPELGEFFADSHGDVMNLPTFPVHSRVSFIVTAGERYLPTMKTVSVGGRDPGERIFLVEKAKANWIAMLLPRGADGKFVQVDSNSAVVMGRVLDLQAHQPLEGQRVEIANHDFEKLSYFGPGSTEPTTRSEGFFSFFNVAKGLTFINRPSSDHGNQTLSLYARGGYGYYVEFGKMGSYPLHGVVDDFSNRRPLDGVAYRLLGDTNRYSAGADGKFTLPEIQFPSGKLTVEFSRDGYPVTLHTAPFSPLDRQWPRKYSMVSQKDIESALYQPGRPKWHYASGMILGKARGSLFDMAQDTAIEIEVRTPSGKKVSSSKGPYPLHGSDPVLGLTREHPGFAYWNLVPGEYIVLWRRMSDREIIRMDVTDVSPRIAPGVVNQDHVSVVD